MTTRIMLDPELATRLGSVFQAVELCYPSGKVLGRFVPKAEASDWEPMIPDVSEEELDRRERSGEKRYSTGEVLAALGKL